MSNTSEGEIEIDEEDANESNITPTTHAQPIENERMKNTLGLSRSSMTRPRTKECTDANCAPSRSKRHPVSRLSTFSHFVIHFFRARNVCFLQSRCRARLLDADMSVRVVPFSCFSLHSPPFCITSHRRFLVCQQTSACSISI
jgi:hypothetical protein